MSTHESAEKKQPSFGEKLRGAAHVVHGIGDEIRGSVMGAFESVSGTEESKAKEENIASKGKSEIERGFARMKGVEVPGSTTAAPESPVEPKTGGQPQEQPAKQEGANATQAPPPSPVDGRQAASEAGRQETTTQVGAENLQKASQETPAASGAELPLEGKAPSGEGPQVSQGPVSGA